MRDVRGTSGDVKTGLARRKKTMGHCLMMCMSAPNTAGELSHIMCATVCTARADVQNLPKERPETARETDLDDR